MLQRLLNSLKTFRVRIILIVALCWLLPMLVLGVYMSGIFVDALKTKTEQALQSGLIHAEDLTVREIERVLKKSKDVTYDEVVYNNYNDYIEGKTDYEGFYTLSRSYWQRMFQREQSMPFTAFFLLDEPWRMVHTANDASEVRGFIDNAMTYILRLGKTLDTRSRFVHANNKLYLVRNLFNRRLERFGMVVLGLKAESLLSPLLDSDTLWKGKADIQLDEFTHIADEDHPFDYSNYSPGLLEEDGSISYSQRIKTSDYQMTYRVRLDQSEVFGQLNEYYRLLRILILLLIPLAGLIMMFIHRRMTKPLARLASATEQMARGELGITVPMQGPDEIGGLGRSFNAMSMQIQELIDISYREGLALRDARISALQSRINPHFMNNALEMMNWQARMEGAESVSQMIEALSTLINAALDRSDERTVPLYSEMEVADAYFFFIKQRFAERISIVKSLDNSLLEWHVPRLIIQTLLENAVEHGIAPAGGGIIRLHAYVQDELLYIDVRNNGKLLSIAEQERINALLNDASRDQSEHIGIRNANLRLNLIYHGEAGLTICSDENGETLARIHLPLDQSYGESVKRN